MTNTLTTDTTVPNQLTDVSRLKNIIENALDEAKQLGADQAEVGASVESGLSVTVRLGDVDTIEHNRDKGLGVTVYFGQRKGSASTTDYSPQAISNAVKAACDIARYTSEDPCSGLADAALMATTIPDLELYHPWNIEVQTAIDIAGCCEQQARDYDKRISNSEGATVNSHTGSRIYANSHGFFGQYPSSRHSLSCCVIAEKNGNMQRDHWYSVARDANDLQSPEQIGELAAQRTISRLDTHKIATCQVPVIFTAEVARGLIGHFFRAINGSLLYREATFLLDSIGQNIFPKHITLNESPHVKKGLGSAAFDSDGVATQAREWVAQGCVQNYVLDNYSARQLNMQTTGNGGGVRNIFVSHTEKDLPSLINTMHRGVVITELMGQGVNMVTGDYSRGASGFWVEDGEIQFAIDEFTIASNLQKMFSQIIEVANDIDTRGNIQIGSILIEQMMVAGN